MHQTSYLAAYIIYCTLYTSYNRTTFTIHYTLSTLHQTLNLTTYITQGAMLSGYVLACEAFPARQRTMAGMMFMMYWPLGMVSLSCAAYVFRSWRSLIMFTSLPGLFVIPVYWLVGWGWGWELRFSDPCIGDGCMVIIHIYWLVVYSSYTRVLVSGMVWCVWF